MLNIAVQRLHHQRLVQTQFQAPGEVVAWMGAVQAQEYAFAKWALGLRMMDATDAVIEQAFNEGTILRTHLMRPTWHFVTPADIRWMLELTGPRVNAFNAYKYRQLELDDALFRRSHAAIVKALQGGQQLTRAELREVLQRADIATTGIPPGSEHRTSHILMRAELDGVICSGPRRGKQFTYMLLEERAPHAKTLMRDEALAELTRRYFTSHGPATMRDFAWWSGLTMADVKAGLATLGSPLSHEVINGQTYWFSSAPPIVHKEIITAHLLPVLDEYTVSYKDRSAVLDTRYTKQIGSWNEILIDHAIAVNGQVVGTWQRTLKKDTVVVTFNPFTTLADAEQQTVAAAARRYGGFLRVPVMYEE